jgi:hypothetical protein
MKNIFLFILLSLIVVSCSSNEEPVTKKKVDPTGEIISIETLFDTDDFQDKAHKEILEELKICSSFQKDTSNYLEPACSPRFFKVFPMNEKVNVKNAFLVQIKSKVGGIKLRRFLAFVRERGELVKCNAFVANLIAKIRTKNGYDDLVLRFNDNVEGEIIFYNCLFSWDGFKYVFKTVVAIEGYENGELWRQRIKAELKDSVSNEIYQTLQKNEMIL